MARGRGRPLRALLPSAGQVSIGVGATYVACAPSLLWFGASERTARLRNASRTSFLLYNSIRLYSVLVLFGGMGTVL